MPVKELDLTNPPSSNQPKTSWTNVLRWKIIPNGQGTRKGVPRSRTCTTMVFSWCSRWGFLGIITHKYLLYRAYIRISQRGTLVGIHPTIPWNRRIHQQKNGSSPSSLPVFHCFFSGGIIKPRQFRVFRYPGLDHEIREITQKTYFFVKKYRLQATSRKVSKWIPTVRIIHLWMLRKNILKYIMDIIIRILQ